MQLAGAVSYGGKGGVGIGVAVASLTAITETNLANLVQTDGIGELTATATNSLRVDTIAAGIAAQNSAKPGGAAGAGMAAINVVETSTVTELVNVALDNASNQGIILGAFDTSYFGVGAGGLAIASGKVAVGIGIAINTVSKATNSRGQTRGTALMISGSDLRSSTGNIGFASVTDQTFVAVAIGAAASRNLSLAGSAAVNKSTLSTVLSVDDASNIHVSGEVTIAADDRSDYSAVAGALAIAVPTEGFKSGAGGASVCDQLD